MIFFFQLKMLSEMPTLEFVPILFVSSLSVLQLQAKASSTPPGCCVCTSGCSTARINP